MIQTEKLTITDDKIVIRSKDIDDLVGQLEDTITKARIDTILTYLRSHDKGLTDDYLIKILLG